MLSFCLGGARKSRPFSAAARALFPALAAEATSFGSRERERLRSPMVAASELHRTTALEPRTATATKPGQPEALRVNFSCDGFLKIVKYLLSRFIE